MFRTDPRSRFVIRLAPGVVDVSSTHPVTGRGARHRHLVAGWRRGFARGLALMIALAVLLGSFTAPAGAAQRSDAPPLDLAAMVLTPFDLDAIGLEGFGRDPGSSGDDMSLLPHANTIAYQRNIGKKEVIQIFEDAGWLRGYTLPLKRLTDPLDSDSVDRSLYSSVVHYATDEGADGVFEYQEDESGFNNAELYEDIGVTSVGDESELTLESMYINGPDPIPVRIRLSFRSGPFIGEVTLMDEEGIIAEGETAPSPEDITAVEEAAYRMLERMEEVSAQREPRPGVLVLRLESELDQEGTDVLPLYSIYLVQDGQVMRNMTQTRAEIDAADEANQAAGLEATYSNGGEITLEDSSIAANMFAAVDRYEDDASAQAALEAKLEKYSDAYDGVEGLVDMPRYGDDSLALSYIRGHLDGEPRTGFTIFTRVDNDLISTSVWSHTLEMPPLSVQMMMEEQLRCYEAGSCLEEVPAPAALRGEEVPVASSGEANASKPGGKSSAGRNAGETYESPNYGYSLVYDPEEWEILLEDEAPNDPYDTVYLFNGTSLIGLAGDPDYEETDLASCIADYGQSLEQEDGVTDVRRVRGRDHSGSEEGREWVTFNYISVDGTGAETETTRYYECRSLGDGVSLVIMHDAATEDFDDEVDVREALLEGFEPEGGR